MNGQVHEILHGDQAVSNERPHGIFADLKNVPARIHVAVKSSDSANRHSIGLAEMQVRRAAELLGLDIRKAADRDRAVDALTNDASAIDLLARNIADYQRQIGSLSPCRRQPSLTTRGGRGWTASSPER